MRRQVRLYTTVNSPPNALSRFFIKLIDREKLVVFFVKDFVDLYRLSMYLGPYLAPILFSLYQDQSHDVDNKLG